MVFPGRLSTGCASCRSRKVKCDETRPGCYRCQRYGSECPGYQRGLIFLLPKDPLHGKWSRASRLQNLTKDSAIASASLSCQDITEDSENSISLSHLQQPRRSWEDESIMFFLHVNCISPEPGVSFGHLEFLHDLYSSSATTSCLRPATQAAAYLFLSRHYNSMELYCEARKQYGQALRSIRMSLSNLKLQRQDDILSALMLLSLIEDFDGVKPSVKMFHLQGISQLLEAQDYKLIIDLQRGSLYQWVFTQLMIYSFATGQRLECLSIPDNWMWELGLRPSYGTRLAIARISHLYFKTTQHIGAWTVLPMEPLADRNVTLSILHKAMGLQVELSFWESSIPTTLRLKEIPVRKGDPMITYTSRWVGSVWTLYYSALVLFYWKVLSCSEIMLGYSYCKTPEETVLISSTAMMAERNILRLIKVICGGIAYLLGRVNENGECIESSDYKASILYNMVWPLAVVSRCRLSSESQRKLSRGSLEYIGVSCGLSLAYAAEDIVAEVLGDFSNSATTDNQDEDNS